MLQDTNQPHLPVHDFETMLENLERQDALYESLIALSERERDAISHANLKILAEVVATKERIVTEARHLEAQREKACAQWAIAWGMAQPPTLREMRDRASSPSVALRLEAAAVKLSRRVQSLRQANGQNVQLITQAQRLGENMIAIALRFGHHPVYDSRGDAGAEQRPSLFLDYRV